MAITLYGTKPSPPVHSVRLMLDSKGLDHKEVWLLPGLHPALLRTRGFRGGTVPGLKIDGRRLQESRVLSRAAGELTAALSGGPGEPARGRGGGALGRRGPSGRASADRPLAFGPSARDAGDDRPR